MCDDRGSLIFYTGAMVFEGDPFYNVEKDHLVHEAGTISFDASGRMICDNFETDHLGSTRRIVRTIWGQSTVGDVTNYYPFGLAWNSQYTNLDQNKYLFSGKELQDAAVGRFGMLHLYDFGSRFYNPTMARWFNVDPALQGVNPYVYCGNSPVVHVDPDGEFFFSLFAGPVGAILDAACWGAVVGGATYTASVALSSGGFDN